jgi:hypothetical protein
MKITKYVTATAGSFEALDTGVAHLLSQGFQPYGSPYLSDNKVEGAIETFIVAQAMVRWGGDIEGETPAPVIAP